MNNEKHLIEALVRDSIAELSLHDKRFSWKRVVENIVFKIYDENEAIDICFEFIRKEDFKIPLGETRVSFSSHILSKIVTKYPLVDLGHDEYFDQEGDDICIAKYGRVRNHFGDWEEF